MIDVCYFSDELGTDDVRESLRMGVEAGATAIEIRSRLFGGDVNTMTDDDVATLQGYLAEFGARVGVIGSGTGKYDLYNPDEVALNSERFDRMIELARAFDTDIIRCFGFWNPYWKAEHRLQPDIPGIMPDLRAVFGPLIERAEKANVFIAFEPEGDTNTGNCKQCREIIDGLGGSDSLAVAWDVNNAARTGEIPMPDGYGYVKGLVQHVHVKPDSNRSIATVADTSVSYRDVFTQLDADGYTGPASVEHWGSPEAMLDGIRQTRALLDDLGLL